MKNARYTLLSVIIFLVILTSNLNAQINGYGADGLTGNWVAFPADGDPITIIGPTTANGQGGDFLFDFLTGFYTTSSGVLVAVLPTSGTTVPIATITGLDAGQTIVGMGFSTSDITMYLITSNFGIPAVPQLYRLNVGTAVATLVGNVTNASGLLAIAINCAGEIYGFDAATDNLISIDPTTAAGTPVGPLGVTAGAFAMDADFDPDTGELFWTHFNGASGELRTVDVSTGNSTLVTTWAVDLISMGMNGTCPPVSVEQTSNEIPLEYQLHQNYPNPFNPSTNIEYSITSESFVELKVYDVLGNEVATLVSEQQSAGVYRADFTGSELSSAIYFYRLQAGSFIETKKMILLR